MTPRPRAPWWAPWRRCWEYYWRGGEHGRPERAFCWLVKGHTLPHQGPCGFDVREWSNSHA